MKTAITILALVVHAISLNAQTYFNLQGGVAERKLNGNTTLTYQVGVRYQFSDLGVKASFNQTDGLFHTFDSYTLSGTYSPLNGLYASLGYRFDNGRDWHGDRHGINAGINGLIPLTGLSKIIVSMDVTYSNIVITNIMVGVQLDLKLSKTGTKRFF